jgi:hypothetical protein
MPPRKNSELDLPDDASIPDIEEMLYESEGKRRSSQSEFSDEEMEAAMADLPPTKLMATRVATNTRKRPRPIECDGRENHSKQRRRGRSVSKENQIKKRKPLSEDSSRIIELTSESESESSPVIVSAKRSSLGPKHAKEPVQPDPEDLHLFFPSSPPPFKDAGTDRSGVEEKLGQLGDAFRGEKDDEGDDRDFQLDMSLFEEDPHIGPDYSGVIQVKLGPKLPTSVSSALYGSDKESLRSRSEKQEDMTQSRVELAGKEGKEVILEDSEDDDTAFDNFFSGVEIV